MSILANPSILAHNVVMIIQKYLAITILQLSVMFCDANNTVLQSFDRLCLYSFDKSELKSSRFDRVSSNLNLQKLQAYGSGDFSSSWGALFLLLTSPPRGPGSGLAFRDPAGVAPADLVLRFFPGTRLTSLC